MRRLVLLAAVVLPAAIANAQNTALAGRVVRAGSTSPIAGAEVVLAPGGSRMLTDSDGRFRFESVASGRLTIHVRRLGFAPESVVVELPRVEAAELLIELRETAQKLDTVSVSGREDVLARGKLAGFYERKKFGIGRFLEAKDIENMHARQLADIIVARMPGTRARRSARGGMAAYIATSRMAPRALVGGASSSGGAISSRAPRPTICYPDVYLDGAVVFSSGSEQDSLFGGETVLFDINSINPEHVSAIEFYAGAAQMPAQYNRTGSACGALLIWTK